jgi:tetratricopeptide (TPR) repeat protein
MTRLLTISVFVLSGDLSLTWANPQSSTLSEPVAPVAAQEQTAPTDLTSNNLRLEANRHWHKGEVEKAIECYEAVIRKPGNPGKPDDGHATDLYALGSLSVELGRLEDARNYYERSLVVFQRAGDKFDEGETYQAIGGLLLLQGQLPAAEIDLRKGLAILSQRTGPDDLRMARAWSRLGWYLTTVGRYDEATQAIRKARAIAERALPPNSPHLIHFLDSQATLLSKTGRFAEAQRLWNQAVNIAERAGGAESPEYDCALLHLAQLDSSLGEYDAAEKLFQEYLLIERKLTPQGSVPAAMGMAELGSLYIRLGQYEKAEPLFVRSVELLDMTGNHVPMADAEVHSCFGDYWMARRKWSDAETHYRRALEVRERYFGKNPLVAESMLALSKSLDKLKRKSEARKLKAEAREIIIASRQGAYNTGDTVDITAFRASK